MLRYNSKYAHVILYELCMSKAMILWDMDSVTGLLYYIVLILIKLVVQTLLCTLELVSTSLIHGTLSLISNTFFFSLQFVKIVGYDLFNITFYTNPPLINTFSYTNCHLSRLWKSITKVYVHIVSVQPTNPMNLTQFNLTQCFNVMKLEY